MRRRLVKWGTMFATMVTVLATMGVAQAKSKALKLHGTHEVSSGIVDGQRVWSLQYNFDKGDGSGMDWAIMNPKKQFKGRYIRGTNIKVKKHPKIYGYVLKTLSKNESSMDSALTYTKDTKGHNILLGWHPAK